MSRTSVLPRLGWTWVLPALIVAIAGARGVWQVVGRVHADGAERVRFEEDVADGEYDYRLRVNDGGRSLTLGDVHVAVKVARRLEVESCAWDGRASALRVTFSLPGWSAARLTVVDVLGRVIARSDAMPAGTATQQVMLSGDQPLASGLYWVRLEQAGRAVTGKAMVL